MRLWVVGLPLASVVATCLPHEPPTADAAWWGCEALRRPAICELPPSGSTRGEESFGQNLAVWLPAPEPFEVSLIGVPVDVDAEAVSGGTRLTWRQPPIFASTTVVIESALRSWRLELRPPSRPSEAAKKSARARDFIRRGLVDEAISLLEESRRAHAEAGAPSRAARDAQALSFLVIQHVGDLAAADAHLKWAEQGLRPRGEEWAYQPYYRGLIERARGRLASAVKHLDRASDRLQRLGAVTTRAMVEELAVALVLRLGWLEDARRRVERLPPPPTHDPCRRAWHLNRRAWVELLWAEAFGGRIRPAAEAALEEAVGILSDPTHACGEPDRQLNARLHYVQMRLAQGRLDAARRALDGAREIPRAAARLEVRAWEEEVAGRIALRSGRAHDALRHFESMRRRAESSLNDDLVWRAHLGRGTALRAVGSVDGAIRAFERAEDTLAESVQLPDVGVGRLGFLALRQDATWRLAELHLDARKDPAKAFCVLRRAHRRMLAASAFREAEGRAHAPLAERVRTLRSAWVQLEAEGWGLDDATRRATEPARRALEERLAAAVDALISARAPAVPGWAEGRDRACAAPTRGLLLGIFERREPNQPRESWVFLQDSTRTVVRRAPRPWSNWLGDWLGVRDEVRDAERIWILADRAARSRAPHAVKVGSRPLAATVPVAFTLDLEPVASARSEGWVIVEDPTQTLVEAEREGRGALDTLRRQGEPVRLLSGGSATRGALESALRGGARLYFAGHAATGSGSIWQDGLRFADGRWTVADVLAGPAPEQVILTACGAGGPRDPLRDRRLSLGEAFVLRGSREALVGVGRVSDAHAAIVGKRAIRAAPSRALVDRFHHMAVRTASTTWAPFQVLVRSQETEWAAHDSL